MVASIKISLPDVHCLRSVTTARPPVAAAIATTRRRGADPDEDEILWYATEGKRSQTGYDSVVGLGRYYAMRTAGRKMICIWPSGGPQCAHQRR